MEVLCACVSDMATPLRLLAVDHLTRTGPGHGNEELLQTLREDRSANVRSRMKFFDERWPKGARKEA